MPPAPSPTQPYADADGYVYGRWGSPTNEGAARQLDGPAVVHVHVGDHLPVLADEAAPTHDARRDPIRRAEEAIDVCVGVRPQAEPEAEGTAGHEGKEEEDDVPTIQAALVHQSRVGGERLHRAAWVQPQQHATSDPCLSR